MEDNNLQNNSIKTGTWFATLNSKGRIDNIQYSEELISMFGYSRDMLPNTVEAMIELVHPDDIGKLVREVTDVYDTPTGGCSIECRALNNEGEYILFSVSGQLVRMPDGVPDILHGSVTNVSDLFDASLSASAIDYRSYSQLLDESELVSTLYQMMGAARWQATYDEDGVTKSIYYSDEFRKLFGYESVEEFPNTKEMLISVIIDEDKVKAEKFIVEVEKGTDPEKVYETEYRIVTKQKEVRWVKVVCKKAYNRGGIPCEVIGIIMDINNDKIVERQSHLVDLLSRDYSSVWYINARTHRMTLVRQNDTTATTDTAINDGIKNESYEKMFEDYIERFVNEADKNRVRKEVSFGNLLTKVKEGELYSINYLRDNLDGSNSYFQICFARFKNNNGRLFFTCGFRDVDSLMRSKLEEAEEANKAKSNFLFNMSHDIRTPMNAIIGFTNLAIQKKDDEELLGKYLSNIKASSENLLEILNSVLEMAKIENGRLESKRQLTKVNEFFDSVVDMFRESAADKNQTLTYENNTKHELLYMDKSHVEEIIMNLVSNSIKYTPEGGEVNLKITEEMGQTPMDCYINIFVSDNGVGMSQEFLEHVYDLFSRERTSDTVNVSGTGLGLAITKRIVDFMDGSINIDSKLGKGTRISVTLPLKVGDTDVDDAELDGDVDMSVLHGMRLLLAEDNDLNAEIATELLLDAHFTVERAADGVECVEMLKNSDNNYYDVVLMDIQMPNMDGYQAAKTIRLFDEKDKANIPIIAVTANAFEEDRNKALLSGMNAHIAKPFELSNVFRTLANVLEHRHYFIDNTKVEQFRDKYLRLGAASGCFIYDDTIEGNIVFVDDFVVKLFGCHSKDELIEYIDGSFRTMIYPDDVVKVTDVIDAQLVNDDTEPCMAECRIATKDSRIRDIAAMISKVYDGSEFIYYVFVTDITDIDMVSAEP